MSNLRDHLQRCHSTVYSQDSGQPKIDLIMKMQKYSLACTTILDSLIVEVNCSAHFLQLCINDDFEKLHLLIDLLVLLV